MKKYRIVEVREPMRATYRDEKSKLPEFVRYTDPFYQVEERTSTIVISFKKGIHYEWKPLDMRFVNAMAARFYIYNHFSSVKKRIIAEL